jgi:large subunit ribosomal protein L5
MSVLSSIMALQSISGLKADPFFAPINEATREWKIGQVAGATVTIDSGDRMWSFLDRFVNCVLPRIREWPGFDSRAAWQGNGELRVFVDAQAVGYFPEIESYFDQYPALYDLEVSFNTNTKFRNEAVTLLSGFQIPFLGREVEMRMQEEAKKKQESSDPFAKYRAKNKRKSGMGARGGQTVARGSTKR